MTSLYDRIAARPEGARALAAARLRQEVLALLHEALEESELSQSELAKRLGVRRSATNQVFRGDGNVRVNTLAEHLHAMGFELDLRLVHADEPRQAELENRAMRPVHPEPGEVMIQWQRQDRNLRASHQRGSDTLLHSPSTAVAKVLNPPVFPASHVLIALNYWHEAPHGASSSTTRILSEKQET